MPIDGMNEEPFSLLLSRCSLAGILLGIVATFYLLGGLAGYVTRPYLTLPVAAAVVGAALFFLTNFFALPKQTSRLGRVIWALILVILVVETILGCLPPTARDELTHHLAIPRLYVKAGQIIQVPMAPYSYYPMLLDMLYTPWVYWGCDFVPKLIHGLFGYLTGLCLYAYLGRRMNAVYGLLGFFFFVSTPAVLRLSHWAYVDLGVTFFSTASLLCLLRWHEKQDETKWLVLAALSTGFALATKPNAMVAGLILFSLFLLLLLNGPKKKLTRVACHLVIFPGLMLLPFLPWLIKNWLQTGSPFYPLLPGFFPANNSTATLATSFPGLGVMEKRRLLYGESIGQIAALPLRVFFFGQDDNPQFFDGVLTPILILFLPWAFKGKWIADKKVFISFAVLFFLYALFLVDLRVRYVLLIVPPLVALLVYGVFNAYLSIKRPAYLFAALLLFAGWHGAYLWHYFRKTAPLPYILGRESRGAFLTRRLPDYPVFEYINHELPPQAKIYLLFIGRKAYYCERDYFHDGGELPGFLLKAVQTAKKPAQINKTLKTKNITHLMVREDLLKRFLLTNLTRAQGGLWNDFVTTHLKLVFHHDGYAIYQLHGSND
jgi:hypothetical protein